MVSKMKVFVSVFLFVLVSAEQEPPKLDEQFRQHNIVPQLISEAPKEVLEIVYAENITVSLGNELTPTQVKSEPHLHWTADPEAKYTVVMEDPDAANSTGFLHWLVVNIPGTDITSGQVKAEYVGSGPPKGSGLHRYIFTVYKQSGEIEFTEPFSSKRSAGERVHFTSAKFAAKYNMGNPIAGNFYEAQYDDYVPILHNQFKKALPTPPATTVISVPEYITISTPTLKGQSLDPHNESLEQDSATAGASITTDPIPHDGLIKATVVESDSTIHTKLENAEHSSGESSEESFITTEPTVPHDGEIKAVYKLNDSVPHIKVLTEEELTHHTTPNLDSTEPSVTAAHEGIVHVAYIANDSVIHSVSHTEQELKEFHQHIDDEFKDTNLKETKGDVKDSKYEESKIDEVKVDAKENKAEETKVDEPHRQDPITPISGEIDPVSTETKSETKTTEVNSGSTVGTYETTTAGEGVSTSTQDSTTRQVSTPSSRPLQVLHHRTGTHEELGHTVPVSIVLVDDSSPPYHHHVGHVNAHVPNAVKSSTESVTTSRAEEVKTIEESKTDVVSTEQAKVDVVSTEQSKTNEEVKSTTEAKDVSEDSKSTVEGVPNSSTPLYETKTSISVLTSAGEKTEDKPAEDVAAYSSDVLKGAY